MGHFGTTPGLNLIYAHLNRVIVARDLDMIYVIGPGHGGPGIVANAYLEGTYSEFYPHITQDEEGLRRLFRQFSFPGRHPESRVAGDPGLDPRGRRARVLARCTPTERPSTIRTSSWPASSATVRPRRRRWRRPGTPTSSSIRSGTVRCCRSSISTVTRSPTRPCWPGSATTSCDGLLEGYGHRPIFVAGDDPLDVHEQLAAALDRALDEIADIQTGRAQTAHRAVVPSGP